MFDFLCLAKVQHYFSNFNVFLMLFRQALLQGCFIKYKILRSRIILHRSLLFIAIAMNEKSNFVISRLSIVCQRPRKLSGAQVCHLCAPPLAPFQPILKITEAISTKFIYAVGLTFIRDIPT